MKLFAIIFLGLMLQAYQASSQKFSLNISYNTAEKSKDSHSYTETFSIIESTVSYSVNYAGRKNNNTDDEAKICNFTAEQIKKVQQVIVDKELDRIDSLVNVSTGMNSITLSISIKKDGKQTAIKISGDAAEVSGKSLYKNSMSLILAIKKIMADCR